MSELVITIDGPGGTGKSTVSRKLAERTGLPHLDTGAFYRGATLAVLRAGIDPSDASSVEEIVADIDLDQVDGRMHLDSEDVSGAIRSESVTKAVSAVAAHPGVRRHLVGMQRRWVASHGDTGVVEGRDIGTVVFPEARLKVFLDATPEVRAARRADESGDDIESVLVDLKRRDHLDSTRATSPMIIPQGALVVDTSDLTVDEVVDRLVGLVDSMS